MIDSLTQDFLFEVYCEELPPKLLLKAGRAFNKLVTTELTKLNLNYRDSHFYITPRRIALYIQDLASKQADQTIERKGPALSAAYTADGEPSKATLGFARSAGVDVDALQTLKNEQGKYLCVKQTIPGQSIAEIMPPLLEEALLKLPFKKKMRWGNQETIFVRPVHGVVMLYGNKVIEATILGCRAGRKTYGHRFMSQGEIDLACASSYVSTLRDVGKVIVDFSERLGTIVKEAKALVTDGVVDTSDQDLLDEVTNLVEWPVAMLGQFDQKFLDLPQEVLISSMKDHQRYFPVKDARGALLPQFVLISNIVSKNPSRVVAGNERVLRARLADAAFFYEADKKMTLASRGEALGAMVFQAKLGTLLDKSNRLSRLMTKLAQDLEFDEAEGIRAGELAKCDLATQMVGEFPELQGIMGGYYAQHDGEKEAVAVALKEQYLPRFAGDTLPETLLGIALSIADKCDNLVGTFGIGQIPTGDKDPYGLRRAALGILRMIIGKALPINLQQFLAFSISTYTVTFDNKHLEEDLLNFCHERLRAWYQEQGVGSDVFSAVLAVQKYKPADMNKRIAAVQGFKRLPEAIDLSMANKRVSNLLEKAELNINGLEMNPALFETDAEQQLADEITNKEIYTADLNQKQDYVAILNSLAEMKSPIDYFFEQVMVMTEDAPRRQNRLIMLHKLRTLFLQVADIALLQS